MPTGGASGLPARLDPHDRNHTEDMTRHLRLVVGVAIAAALMISERTARSHVSSVLTKLGLASRTQAALWAIREGIAPDPAAS